MGATQARSAAARVVRLVGRHLIAAFASRHADARSVLIAWMTEIEDSSWSSPAALRQRYPSASIVGEGVVVFRLKGSTYRIAARVDHANGIVRVLAVGTHAEYDRWRL